MTDKRPIAEYSDNEVMSELEHCTVKLARIRREQDMVRGHQRELIEEALRRDLPSPSSQSRT